MSYAHSADWADDNVVTFVDLCIRQGIRPLDLLAVMFSESNASASARNPRDETRPAVAVGLIQFTPAWLGKGHDLEHVRALGMAGQLPLVERFYQPHRGRLGSVQACYLATFLPALMATEWGATTVLCGWRGPLAWAYSANRVFDHAQKGYITPQDLEDATVRACKGPRWDELSGRVLAEQRTRTTDPGQPSKHDTDIDGLKPVPAAPDVEYVPEPPDDVA